MHPKSSSSNSHIEWEFHSFRELSTVFTDGTSLFFTTLFSSDFHNKLCKYILGVLPTSLIIAPLRSFQWTYFSPFALDFSITRLIPWPSHSTRYFDSISHTYVTSLVPSQISLSFSFLLNVMMRPSTYRAAYKIWKVLVQWLLYIYLFLPLSHLLSSNIHSFIHSRHIYWALPWTGWF